MKAILVIDMPTRCDECRFARLYNTILSRDLIMCTAVKNDLFVWRDDKPKWCPLRPIPDKAAEDLVEGLDAIKKMQSVMIKKIIRTE